MSENEKNRDETSIEEIRSLIDEIFEKIEEENNPKFESFVVEDFNDRIRSSSTKLRESTSVDEISSSSLSSSIVDVSSAHSTRPTSPRDSSTNIDKKLLEEIEIYSKQLAEEFVRSVENFSGSLHKMSANTVCSMQTYRDALAGKLNESVETNIRSMHLFMVQAEQLNQQMAPIYELQKKISYIKQLLDILSQSI